MYVIVSLNQTFVFIRVDYLLLALKTTFNSIYTLN